MPLYNLQEWRGFIFYLFLSLTCLKSLRLSSGTKQQKKNAKCCGDQKEKKNGKIGVGKIRDVTIDTYIFSDGS